MRDHPTPDTIFRANTRAAQHALDKLAKELRSEDQSARAAVCEQASRVIDTTSRSYLIASEEIRRLSPIDDPFWMVCRKPEHSGSRTEPKRRFPRLDAAREEARRIAAAAGISIVILVAIEEIAPQDTRSGQLPL